MYLRWKGWCRGRVWAARFAGLKAGNPLSDLCGYGNSKAEAIAELLRESYTYYQSSGDEGNLSG